MSLLFASMMPIVSSHCSTRSTHQQVLELRPSSLHPRTPDSTCLAMLLADRSATAVIFPGHHQWDTCCVHLAD